MAMRRFPALQVWAAILCGAAVTAVADEPSAPQPEAQRATVLIPSHDVHARILGRDLGDGAIIHMPRPGPGTLRGDIIVHGAPSAAPGRVAIPLNARPPADTYDWSAHDAERSAGRHAVAHRWPDGDGLLLIGTGTVLRTPASRRGHRDRFRPTGPVGTVERSPSIPIGVPFHGDIHEDGFRRAQLRFHAASQPRIVQLESGFREAQLRFHRATLPRTGARDETGLRRDVRRVEPRPGRPCRTDDR